MTTDSNSPAFEALLRPKFRWPTKGDQPFTTSDQWRNNSYIDRYGNGRPVMMMTGYKMAADLMVAHIANARNDGDAWSSPSSSTIGSSWSFRSNT